MGFTSKLISGISRVLQKLVKYFNGPITSTISWTLPPVWPLIFSLNLNESLVLLVKTTIAPTKERVEHYATTKIFKYWSRTSPFYVNELFVPSRN